MAKNSKYVVIVFIKYIEVHFEFDTPMGACNFVDMVLDHVTTDEDGENVRVSMIRVDFDENKEVMEEKEGE